MKNAFIKLVCRNPSSNYFGISTGWLPPTQNLLAPHLCRPKSDFEDTKNTMNWLNLLEVGHPLIDAQHRDLMRHLDDIEKAMLGSRPLRLAYSFSLFKACALDHLATEEALMHKSGYPELAAHLEEHKAFRSMINALQEQFLRQDLSSEILDELAYWFIKHVVHADRAYAPYVTTK